MAFMIPSYAHEAFHVADNRCREREACPADVYGTLIADIRASTLGMEQAGHDFSLTRNRHGAGFWDRKSRGPIADAALDRLTEASHAYGEESYLVGNDGEVSVL